MSKRKPSPEPFARDPRIMFDGYKWRVTLEGSKPVAFFEYEEAVAWLEANQ